MHVEHDSAIRRVFSAAGVSAPDEFVLASANHLDAVYRTNRAISLTAIPEADAAELLVFDAVAPILSIAKPTEFLDIGSGAGFPGLMLALWWQDVRASLVDSHRKKASFLEIATTGFDTTPEILNCRAEELVMSKKTWPFVTSRATFPPTVLMEMVLPLISIVGSALLYMSTRSTAEFEEILRLFSNISVQRIDYSLPTHGQRSAVLIDT